MWRWTLNWSEIRDDIVVGSCPVRPADLDRIREEARAGAVLSLQTDACRVALDIDGGVLVAHSARRGIVVANAPMRDFDADEQRRRLPEGVRKLGELLSAGHRTYVHCTAGINRAPLVVLSYLTFVEGMAAEDAMALIRRGRPEASPYWDAYRGCRQDALAAHAAAHAGARAVPRPNRPGQAGGGDELAEIEVLRRAFSFSPSSSS